MKRVSKGKVKDRLQGGEMKR